jgi:hypothetical protein
MTPEVEEVHLMFQAAPPFVVLAMIEVGGEVVVEPAAQAVVSLTAQTPTMVIDDPLDCFCQVAPLSMVFRIVPPSPTAHAVVALAAETPVRFALVPDVCCSHPEAAPAGSAPVDKANSEKSNAIKTTEMIAGKRIR